MAEEIQHGTNLKSTELENAPTQRYVPPQAVPKNGSPGEGGIVRTGVKFSIKDTELILRVMLESDFSGKDVERVSDTMKRVKKLHEELLSQAMEIIS